MPMKNPPHPGDLFENRILQRISRYGDDSKTPEGVGVPPKPRSTRPMTIPDSAARRELFR
jgi:hypothetical protein